MYAIRANYAYKNDLDNIGIADVNGTPCKSMAAIAEALGISKQDYSRYCQICSMPIGFDDEFANWNVYQFTCVHNILKDNKLTTPFEWSMISLDGCKKDIIYFLTRAVFKAQNFPVTVNICLCSDIPMTASLNEIRILSLLYQVSHCPFNGLTHFMDRNRDEFRPEIMHQFFVERIFRCFFRFNYCAGQPVFCSHIADYTAMIRTAASVSQNIIMVSLQNFLKKQFGFSGFVPSERKRQEILPFYVQK